VPRLTLAREALPTFLYGTAWKEERTQALTEMALRAGFRGIDTANQRRHYVEAGVGAALAAAYRSGLVSRGDLFLQTKYTYRSGQDHRLPYDPAAPLAQQVAQSLASSLEHLGGDHVDSYLLHGPASGQGWTESDTLVWAAMARERDAGRVRFLGVSNVSLRHLRDMAAAGVEPPAFVQNRCFARTGWDRAVRAFCAERGIVYQGFSLLTANVEVLRHPLVHDMKSKHKRTTLPLRSALQYGRDRYDINDEPHRGSEPAPQRLDCRLRSVPLPGVGPAWAHDSAAARPLDGPRTARRDRRRARSPPLRHTADDLRHRRPPGAARSRPPRGR